MYTEHDYNEEDKNPNTNGFTCLELFCKFKGYQGGTIHQAIKEFKDLPIGDKDKFCGILVDNMFNIMDIHNINTFMRLRNSNIA